MNLIAKRVASLHKTDQNQIFLNRKDVYNMLAGIIEGSVYYWKEYNRCINAGNTALDCGQYQRKAWQLVLLYESLMGLKIIESARGMGLYEEPPYQVFPWKIPHGPGPVSAYQFDLLIPILAPAIPKKSDPRQEPTVWFHKDNNGNQNFQTRLEATIQVRNELLEAANRLEGQIKQLEVFGK
jgi:hypothetical protein